MTLLKLIIKSLKYYRKQHFAVFAGTLISTAVLTGALIIGDSVKYSLKYLVEKRLGDTRYVLQTNDRFVTKQLADTLGNNLQVKYTAALLTNGIASNPEKQQKANNLQVLGIDSTFWSLAPQSPKNISGNECFINKSLAEDLDLNINDEFIVRANNLSEIPINAPFAEEENTNVSFRVKVKGILENSQLGDFSLKSNQSKVKNIFLSYTFLSAKLDISNLSNLILLPELEGKTDKDIQQLFTSNWRLADAELSIREIDDTKKLEIISNRIFIDNPISNKIKALENSSTPTLTYLVNSLQSANAETPYSFVTATQEIAGKKLAKDEIIINQWLADDINVKTGDSIMLTYFIIGPMRNLKEEVTKFFVKDIIPLTEKESIKKLMPEFPGITESNSCKEWNTGIPIDLDKIRDKDEAYWDTYKGTPKAFISLERGVTLWGNQFGNYTSFRFDSKAISKAELENKLLEKLTPIDLGMVFQPSYQAGIESAENSVDFAGLFLGMSFFVIVAGVLLTVMLYALNTQSRNSEAGLFAALGFKRKAIVRYRVAESIFVILLASIVGAAVGILYNMFIMEGLNSIWNDIVRTEAIFMHINPLTLIYGILGGSLAAFLSIYLVIRRNYKSTIISAIKKLPKGRHRGRGKNFHLTLSLLFFTASLAIVSYSIAIDAIENSGLFLSSGGAFLLSMIFFTNHWLKRKTQTNKLTFNSLALKNTKRNNSRSIGTITMLALGIFSVLITGANRKTFIGADTNRNSGTGGYTFWAETTTPLLHDLNTNAGKEEYDLDSTIFGGANFHQMHSLNGDDASCLNLNQVQKPQILGVNSKKLNTIQAFSFAKLIEKTETNSGWNLLTKDYGENIIPAVADQTVLTWGLKKKVGDTLTYLNEAGKKIHLLIAGGLAASIFQGNLLIEDKLFMEHFPSSGGSKIMLVESSDEKSKDVKEALENTFEDQGIELTPTTERLATFYSVTNTYLALFLALGGLGVIIGTIGLGIVIYRNMLDRKQELATLQALGFKKNQIFKLIFKENLVLLLSGLVIGFLSATIGILPSLLSPSFAIPGGFVFVLVAIIFTSGLLWIYFPAKSAMKKNLIQGLREE